MIMTTTTTTTTTTTMAKAMPMATRAGTIITTATPIRTRGRTWPTAHATRAMWPRAWRRRIPPMPTPIASARSPTARASKLDAAIRQTFAAIPAERRKVVTSHDAFGYFGDAYGVTFIAVAGVSTAAEPSAADVARIIEQVKRERVPAVFVENITSPRLVQQIARETGAKVGGTLYSDALSKPGQPGATYLEMFEWNARQLAAALQP